MTKPRRPHGSGSVYQEHTPACPPRRADGTRPDHKCDGRWIGTYEAGWTTRGTRRRRKITATTERGARQKLLTAIRQAEEAEAPTMGGKPTLKRWADQWLEAAQTRVRPKTWSAHRSLVNHWIVPTIGHRRLDQLAPPDIRAVHRAMETHGLALSTMNRAHAVLGKMLTDAVAEGYTVPQRAREVDGPGTGNNDRDALPLTDALAILETASARPDASRWAAALLQGMRPAECLGLTWDMVDLDAGRLVLAWQLQPLPYNVERDRTSGFRVPRGYEARQVDGALHLVRPKSRKGWRVIPLVPWMVTALEAWRQVAPRSPHGIVWPMADGRPRRDDDDRAAWHAITAAARVAVTSPSPAATGPEVHGRRPTLYEARHTTATLLRAGGVDDETITAIMGHASILSTTAYLHTDDQRTRAALVGLAETLQLTAH